MNVLEYIEKITEGGSRVVIDDAAADEVVNCTSDGQGSYTRVTLYREDNDSRKTRREKEKLVEKVSRCALCCDDTSMFIDHVKMLAPEKYSREDPEDGAERWDRILGHIWISCSMELTKMVLKERFQKSSKILLEVLQSRIKEWRKKTEGKISKELDENGNPTGVFNFIMEGPLL